jgi:hypothetical protein
MVAVEMFGFLSFSNTELAGPADFLPTISCSPMSIILVQKLLIGILDHAFSDEHDVNGM